MSFVSKGLVLLANLIYFLPLLILFCFSFLGMLQDFFVGWRLS